jgi:transposase
MRVRDRQERVRAYRGQIPSPGRPTVAWREDRVRFWAAIAAGAKTREARVALGVSEPVAYRWFLHAGEVNPHLAPTLSGRYLSSSDREEIALWRAQGCGVREIARRLGRSPSTISRELRRNASTRTYRLDYKRRLRELPRRQDIPLVFEELDYQMACQVYRWALPLVSYAQWKNVHYELFGATSSDLVHYESYRDRLGLITANATTPYTLNFFNLAETGPLVV